MEPATSIIRKLGGPIVVADALGLHRTSVWKWGRPRETGGTGGIIPQRQIPRLLDLATRKQVRLRPADFFAVNGSSKKRTKR